MIVEITTSFEFRKIEIEYESQNICESTMIFSSVLLTSITVSGLHRFLYLKKDKQLILELSF